MPRSRRPAFSHAALAFIALLSAVLLGGAQSASCAMHGLGAARSPAATEMGGHAAMGGMSHESTGAPAHDGTGCRCSCIGACTMVAPLATAPSAVTIRVAIVAPAARHALDRDPVPTALPEPGRLLPFANGPPAASA